MLTNRLPYTTQRLGHARPALRPVRVVWRHIPLGHRPSLPCSAAPRELCSQGSSVLCWCLTSPDPASLASAVCLPSADPLDTMASQEISQFLCKECTRMPRLSDRAESDGRSRWRLRPCGLPLAHRCRHSGLTAVAARYPAYARPYRLLVCLLTETSARLGADVVRYTFIVEDLHLLLLASLLANLGVLSLQRGTLAYFSLPTR